MLKKCKNSRQKDMILLNGISLTSEKPITELLTTADGGIQSWFHGQCLKVEQIRTESYRLFNIWWKKDFNLKQVSPMDMILNTLLTPMIPPFLWWYWATLKKRFQTKSPTRLIGSFQCKTMTVDSELLIKVCVNIHKHFLIYFLIHCFAFSQWTNPNIIWYFHNNSWTDFWYFSIQAKMEIIIYSSLSSTSQALQTQLKSSILLVLISLVTS